MTKQITTYLLFAACFFSACQTDYDEPASGTSGEREALSLTVSTSDIVVSDEAVTRASDKGGATTFEIDDCVGLIVLDKDGNFLADNVPYKFDGNNWNFDADNKEGKQRVYYDATMLTYIIYYPYHPSANGIKDESGIKNLPIFAHREDQSDKMAYRFSDLMMWSSTGRAIKQITANLEHTRKSLSLDIKVRWSLGLPKYNILEYQPLKEALEDFKILYQDGTPILNATTDITYHAEDGTYRYILPERYEGRLSWSYTYRGESFSGECTVSTQQAMGTRYVEDTYAYMGESKGEKVEAFDYYCSKDIDGEKYGYVLPWDAEKHFREHHIIGIILHAGQQAEDISDYLESGIGQRSCNGYVIALTDVPGDFRWALDSVSVTKAAKEKVGTHTNMLGWSGYYNLIQMKKYAGTNFARAFPAAYACVIYGSLISEFAAPVNTSGWLLPTYGMWHTAKSLNKEIESCLSTISKNVPDDCSYKKEMKLWYYDSRGYWSSTENDRDSTIAYYFSTEKNFDSAVKTATKSVRAFLVF